MPGTITPRVVAVCDAVNGNGVSSHVAVRAQPLEPPLRCRLQQAQRSRDFLGAEASGRHALHGETLFCRSHHDVRRLENTCDLRELWVCGGYVRQCAIWKNVLICENFYTRGIFDQRELEIVVFHPNFEPHHFIRQIIGKLKSR